MEDVERIARLEAQHQEVMRVLQETREDMKEVRDDMHEVKAALTKWKGLGAGIAITVSCFWAVLIAIWGFITGGK
jgi:hypothetical protein